MTVDIDPEEPNFGESRWIRSEDVNVEHLLDVFTTIDVDSDSLWDSYAKFISHLYWHKSRPTILAPKIEGLPDDHPSKPGCLVQLSMLFDSVGNQVERKQLLCHALRLRGEWRGDLAVAAISRKLSDANWKLGLHKEAIQRAKEALEIYERLGHTVGQAWCLVGLAWLLREDKRLRAAEEAASRAIGLISGVDNQSLVCGSHRILGDIYRSEGYREKAIHHYEVALGIASSFGWHDPLFWLHHDLGWLFLRDRPYDAQAHLECAKSHTADSPYNLGHAMGLQAWVWYRQHRVEEARSETLRAADVFEKLGAAKDVEDCKDLLDCIKGEMNNPLVLYFKGELFELATSYAC